MRNFPLRLATSCLALTLGSVGMANAQGGGDRLLDSLIRGIQICSEINDSANRLACYDDVSRTTSGQQPGAVRPVGPPPGARPYGGAALPPQPQPQLPPGYQAQQDPSGPVDDADRAFDPSSQRSSTVQPEMLADVIGERRSGPGPIPRGNVPLLTLGTPSLSYNEANYRWLVTVALTNNTGRIIDASITCTLNNNDRRVTAMNWFPNGIRPGEVVTVDMLGPSTSAYANSVVCRVNSPI